jgi:uncharacterized protein YggE
MAETPVVAVRGEVVIEVPPEIARFTVTVAARDRDRRAALTRLTERLDAVRAVLDGYAAAVERRETGQVVVQPELKRSGERVSAYTASVSTTVTVTEFAVLGELMLRLADEEQTSVYGPVWALRPDSPVHRRARRTAVDDALARAREYADALGARLERLLLLADAGVSAGPPVPMAFGATTFRAAADATPELNLEPQAQTAHASVEMRFVMSEPTTMAAQH